MPLRLRPDLVRVDLGPESLEKEDGRAHVLEEPVQRRQLLHPLDVARTQRADLGQRLVHHGGELPIDVRVRLARGNLRGKSRHQEAPAEDQRIRVVETLGLGRDDVALLGKGVEELVALRGHVAEVVVDDGGQLVCGGVEEEVVDV